MKKMIMMLLAATSLLLALSEQIEISANHFEALESQKISYFKGAVHVKKGSDEIKSDTLKIFLDAKNKPLKYEAIGGVSFKITTEEQSFEGRSDHIIYEPLKKRYIASGNVEIFEKTKNRTLKGEQIMIDRTGGKSTITGTKNKPVKFSFTVEE